MNPAPATFAGYREAKTSAALKCQHIQLSPDRQAIPGIGYLVNTGHRLVAIDSGTTDGFVETLGNYQCVLGSAGYSASQVIHVNTTHLHLDNYGI